MDAATICIYHVVEVDDNKKWAWEKHVLHHNGFFCDANNNRTPSSLHAHSVEYALSVVLE